MLNDKFMLNDWEQSGNEEKELNKLLESIDLATSQVRTNLTDFFVEHIYEDTDGSVYAYVIDPDNVLPDGRIADGQVRIELLDDMTPEFRRQSLEEGLVLRHKRTGERFIVSSSAYPTLGQRITLPGTAMQFNSLARDCLIAEHIGHHSSGKTMMILKSQDGIQKAFAFLGPEYKHVKMDAIRRMAQTLKSESGLGETVCLSWNVTHAKAQVTYAFPEYGKDVCETYKVETMTPCVKLMTSDTGECSVRAVGLWRTDKGDELYIDEYSRRHQGIFDVEDIMQGTKENIFDKYKEFPKRLQELSYVKISPETFNLSTADGLEAHKKFLIKVYKTAIEDLGLKVIIGQRRMQDLSTILEFLVDETTPYTAYAVAKDILAIPGMLRSWMKKTELKGTGEEKLTKALSKAPYLDFVKIAAKAAKYEPEMYFTPEEE